ncbi:MAG: metal ABC transporter solute-binding protein, Zn/Mn family, partial [Desulfovibrionaceae bacterium]
MHQSPAAKVLVLLGFLVTFCLAPGISSAQNLHVFVSIPPQKQMVQRLAAGRAEVHVLLPRAASPAAYEPKPRQMAALESADLYVAIGVPFEKTWMKRFQQANPDMAVVHMDEAVRKRPMARSRSEAGHAGHHDHHGHHDHGSLDPHVWLSPPLVRVMAQTVRDALIQADPEGSAS